MREISKEAADTLWHSWSPPCTSMEQPAQLKAHGDDAVAGAGVGLAALVELEGSAAEEEDAVVGWCRLPLRLSRRTVEVRSPPADRSRSP